ncbi:sigma-70 family RNA polymerase sigma factor [Pseudofrankia inefficax]|uniref:RNA polymerase, sigma-24 subunit, ECF subfamily n=1 Tax=Pseudofrankia inefficax (strain DSM 45817 / CECT 9037 / DDB 130130 / EuI1c) TaxID=298654 RepID=E3J4E0_PSEI1|nr:sigma-70 family RNA polymerase sigma factor [Pseudofrankia inefficax]ADP83059.1 RNA polymerase, sigma-24 subunit, ECF subfamily [Pseudofrankia inefficax]
MVTGDRPRPTTETASADAELHRRLVAGDETALCEAYRLFGKLVHTLAQRVTRDRDAAGDIVQDVFGYLWERPLRYDPNRAALRTWLAMLAHRRAVDWVRAEERQRAAAGRFGPPQEAVPSAAETVEVADTFCRVRHTVAGLPESLRTAVELAFYRGMTYREVAAELGIPEGTAKSRMRSALARIARALAEEGIGG